jgi:hypothetical protein
MTQGGLVFGVVTGLVSLMSFDIIGQESASATVDRAGRDAQTAD